MLSLSMNYKYNFNRCILINNQNLLSNHHSPKRVLILLHKKFDHCRFTAFHDCSANFLNCYWTHFSPHYVQFRFRQIQISLSTISSSKTMESSILKSTLSITNKLAILYCLFCSLHIPPTAAFPFYENLKAPALVSSHNIENSTFQPQIMKRGLDDGWITIIVVNGFLVLFAVCCCCCSTAEYTDDDDGDGVWLGTLGRLWHSCWLQTLGTAVAC